MFKINSFKEKRKDIINNNKIVSIGTRADESHKRSKMRDRGKWNKMDFIFPIFNFSADDVKNIIRKNNILLHYFYKTEKRLSCTCCYQQTKKAWKRMRIFYPDEWLKALKFYSLAMQNKAFMTGQSGYQFDLFKNIINDDDDLAVEGFETDDKYLWRPS